MDQHLVFLFFFKWVKPLFLFRASHIDPSRLRSLAISHRHTQTRWQRTHLYSQTGWKTICMLAIYITIRSLVNGNAVFTNESDTRSNARCELVHLEPSSCDRVSQDRCWSQVWAGLFERLRFHWTGRKSIRGSKTPDQLLHRPWGEIVFLNSCFQGHR